MTEQAEIDVTTESPEVIAAAKWWADIIRGGAKFDNGDPSPTGGMAWAMATMARVKVDDAVLDKFEDELKKGIIEHTSGKLRKYGCTLSVDYGPDRVLSDAMRRAGGADNGITLFPWKTVMWVEAGKVVVRYGYGAPEKTIYPQEV